MRIFALYTLSVVILTYYGIEVCPYIETLSPFELMLILGVAFAISGSSRALILHLWKSSNKLGLPKPWHYLILDLSMWFFTGVLVTIWNALHYDFPLESGLKIVLGCLTLGIFSASYIALEIENELIHRMSENDGLKVSLKENEFFSITTKFLIFALLSVIVVTGVLLLLIYKDFNFVIEALSNDQPFEFIWVVREILFVMVVLLLGSYAVARQYSRNIRLMFELQLKSFGAVEQGNYDTFVPVISHDEFGIIANQTNQMIVNLKQKARIEKALGKYMSPTVADAILNNEQETHLGGRELDLAILFTDLRDFTPISEKCSAQEVVSILNDYFTLVVSAVHKHGGVLDKFIGDAAMAIFGLDKDDAQENAVLAALDIQSNLEGLNKSLSARNLPQIRNGIGIHWGTVIAGNIGSEERLEYTVVGDAVNTSARLENLTKKLPSSVAISEALYSRLSPALQNKFNFLQSHSLKGKTHKVSVYGLSSST
jgi:class 3 adenylate cyclase